MKKVSKKWIENFVATIPDEVLDITNVSERGEWFTYYEPMCYAAGKNGKSAQMWELADWLNYSQRHNRPYYLVCLAKNPVFM